MFSALGYRVVELDRESFGGITVKGLNPGDYKTLTFKEIEKLIQK
jgi:23S rRNA pseudouridine2605 synthase